MESIIFYLIHDQSQEGPKVDVTFLFANSAGNNLVPRVSLLSLSLPPLVVGTETPVAAGHVTTQNLGGRKICWKGGATGFSSRPNVLEYPPTLRFRMDRWTRDQPQPGSLFQRLREAEKRDPGNEVVRGSGL